MAQLPFISVIMPVRNEADFIARSIQSVLAQDYPSDKIEVIVADGKSVDGTREILEEASRADPRITVIDNPGLIAPTGLNAATAKARGKYVFRVDGHCELMPDYFRRAVNHLQKEDVHAVGAPIETVGISPVSQGIAAAMSSRFGVGGSAFRTIKGQALFVDTVAFPGYSRDLIDAVGPYDERFVRNQDDEYNYRVRKMGWQILLAPDLGVRYFCRASLLSLWRQYFQYGYWKVEVLRLHPRQMSLRQFIPAAFVLSLFLLTLVGLWDARSLALSFALLLLYFCASSIAAIDLSIRHGWRLMAYIFAAFWVLHFSYGVGFIIGFARNFAMRVPSITGKSG